MQQFVNRFGMIGALIFVLIQIVQVVFPIIPGGISCLAGVLLFGAIPGFFYNYIGICVGSCIAFGIARSLGRPVLYKDVFRENDRKIPDVDGAKRKIFKTICTGHFSAGSAG